MAIAGFAKQTAKVLFGPILYRDNAIMRRARALSVVNLQRILLCDCIRQYGAVVQSGPFSGMAVACDHLWGSRLPKHLGSYESELHPWIERLPNAGYDSVVNIGCAEGYYAIGLARLLPGARVYAFDISVKAQAICRKAAAENGVSSRVTVAGECTLEILRTLLSGSRKPFLILDCEGAEMDLLQPDLAPQLQRADVLVECHDFARPDATSVLKSRFAATHRIEQVREGPRDPDKYGFLRKRHGLERAIALCEFRPEIMTWLFLTSKASV